MSLHPNRSTSLLAKNGPILRQDKLSYMQCALLMDTESQASRLDTAKTAKRKLCRALQTCSCICKCKMLASLTRRLLSFVYYAYIACSSSESIP